MSKPVPPTYRTTNWRAYNAALKQRGSLLIWFDPEMEWLAVPSGRRGRPATFSDAAIQTCLMLKALLGLALRQATGLVASLLKLARLNWPVPDFSTLCRRQKDLTVTIPYRPSSGALHLLIDSTGIKAMGEGEWSCRKHGASRPCQWAKVHLGIDAETLEIRAIEGELANAAGWAMAPCSPSCSSRSRPRNSSGLSRPMEPMITDPVTPPSLPARPRPSFPPAVTAGHGKRPHQEPRPATRSCAQAAASVGQSGDTGAAITGEVSLRPRCGA
jgi:hypothetical protein